MNLALGRSSCQVQSSPPHLQQQDRSFSWCVWPAHRVARRPSAAYPRRAQAILALLRDPERLERERKDFAARRPALSGFSRDAAPAIGLGLSSAATFVSQVFRDQRATGGVGGSDDGRVTSPDLRCGSFVVSGCSGSTRHHARGDRLLHHAL